MSVMSEIDSSVEEVLELLSIEVGAGRLATPGELIERANFHARARNPINVWPVLLPEVTRRVFAHFDVTLH